MKREAGEHRAPGPPPSCSTSHLAVRAGPAVERAGACTCPPPLTAPAPTRRKSLPNTEPERRTRSDGCSSSSSSSPGLCLRRRARERHHRGRNGHRAHPIFKRTIIYAHCLRVSPRGQSLHQSAWRLPRTAAVFRSCRSLLWSAAAGTASSLRPWMRSARSEPRKQETIHLHRHNITHATLLLESGAAQ